MCRKKIQQLFWERLDLNIDKSKFGGSGNTNNGNMARRVFQNIDALADVTSVDINLLKKLKTILVTISCQFLINSEKFEAFCFETSKLYKEKYLWYPMPATLHKILVHRRQIIEHCVLPLRYFS